MDSKVNKHILNAIDKAMQDKNEAEPKRTHLGASLVGQPCTRKTWYGFRWAKEEKFSGRMLRLFARGHLEEFRFVDYLRSIGFVVYDVDNEGNQFRVSDVMGHAGGSCDGFCYFPMGFPDLPPGVDHTTPILTEYKTSGLKGFEKLEKLGMKKAKPEHWSQICFYGYKFQVKWFLYIAVNKNNDDLHIEFGPIDLMYGKQMIDLAEGIINSSEPPPRKYAQGHFQCKEFCNFNSLCHFSEQMEKNCRSCKNAKPIENKQWACQYHNVILTPETIEVGCDSWIPADV